VRIFNTLVEASMRIDAPSAPLLAVLLASPFPCFGSSMLLGSDDVPLTSAVVQGEPVETRTFDTSEKARLRTAILSGLLPEDGSRDAVPAERRAASLAVLSGLGSADALRAAIEILEGEGIRPNLFAIDPQVRRAIFAAMARDAEYGQPRLVVLAVTADDPIGSRASDALPKRLSLPALAEIARQLGGSRELHVNRAAALASAHAAAELIPALVSAQYAPPRAQQKGDEAWIAIGKTVHYVQNVIPIVGGASTSFQPVIGTVYEGSLLRVMESKVEIFRTEVHDSLAAVIEETTGQPAPALGYDRDRWLVWYRDEFPRLAEAHRVAREDAATAGRARTTPAGRDG
jgi:hypothetical protein